MTCLAYPDSPPLECIKHVVSVITGQTAFDLKTTAQNGWTVQGYLQGALIGEAHAEVIPPEAGAAQAEGILDLIPKELLLKYLFTLLSDWLSKR